MQLDNKAFYADLFTKSDTPGPRRQLVPAAPVVPVAAVLVVTIAVFGPMGRDQVDLVGLDRDPFAVIIQGIWEGLQALGGG